MNYKILQKICIIFFILLICISQFSIKSYSAYTLDNIITEGDTFINASSDEKLNTTKMKDISNTIYNILLSLGIVVAVVFATILGVQYMTSAAEDKAQVKESLIPFIIGCIVVFGAFAIWKAIVTVLM